jgi:hypothetical protein
MIGKKINQLATELAPVSTDLTIIGDPTTGVSKKITLAQLGAIFSGAVSFYTNLAAFPNPGTIDVIYCAKDTQKLYLWSGSAYVEVFPSQALLDTYQLRSEKGNANGYASLDSGGKVPISQLPSSIMEYKGTWNASTNTPTLANGTGDTGDVYICNVAGTVNFGAGNITFAVGDYVIYSGSIWQRSSGAVGTVTSVALTVGGDAISVSGSPLTTSGTLGLAFSGTTSQYIRGNGTLANFPTSLVTGTGTINSVTKWSFTSGEIINSNIYDTGSVIYNNNPSDGQFAWQFNGSQTTGLSYGALIVAGTNASDIALRIQNASSTSEYFFVWGDGRVQINNIPNATTDTDKFLVSDSGVIKYRTGAELLSDIGGASASGYVPYTGATANLDLGTHTLLAAKGTFSSSGSGDTVGITHSSGSGIALNITKGGNGEGLYINKTSGSGNAATIIGTLNATTLVKSGGTSSQFLKADGSVDSTSYGTGSVTSVGLSSATSGVTIGSTPITTSGTITLAIATASGSQQGLLSSTDWTTFNNKQSALTNPVTGTGTTNYLPKFTGTSTIGNSLLTDNGTNIGLGVANPTAGRLQINVSDTTTAAHLQIVDGTTTLANSFVTNFRNANDGNGRYSLSSWQVQNAVGNDQNGFIGVQSVSGAGAYTPNIVFGQRTGASTYATRMTLDASGNLGLGVTPSAWASGYKVAQYQGGFLGSDGTSYIYFGQNAYSDGTFKYLANGLATIYAQDAGKYIWYQAPSGTAGNAISFTQAMTLDASGNLVVGDTTTSGRLRVVGNAATNGLTVKSAGNGGTFPFRVTWANGTDGSMLCVEDNGRVGIGTTTPGRQLEIYAANDAYMKFNGQRAGNNAFTIGNDNSGFIVYDDTNGIYRLKIANSTGAATFSSSVTANQISSIVTSGTARVTIGDGSVSGGALLNLAGVSGGKTWFISSNYNIGGGLEFIQSTTNGGTTPASGAAMLITSGGNIEIATGSIKTGEPDTGWGRAAIKIGARVSGTAFGVGGYLPVSVDGTVYYINLNSSTP